jgi:hypothetical protein
MELMLLLKLCFIFEFSQYEQSETRGLLLYNKCDPFKPERDTEFDNKLCRTPVHYIVLNSASVFKPGNRSRNKTKEICAKQSVYERESLAGSTVAVQGIMIRVGISRILLSIKQYPRFISY